jgi:hypothetical protein
MANKVDYEKTDMLIRKWQKWKYLNGQKMNRPSMAEEIWVNENMFKHKSYHGSKIKKYIFIVIRVANV